MALLFDNASSEYAFNAGTPITATPLTIAAWVKSDDIGNAGSVLTIADGATEVNYLQLLVVDNVRALTRDSGGSPSAQTVATFSAGEWVHACAVFASATSRSAYLNGANKVTNTGSATPSGIDRLAVGVLYRNSLAQYMSGVIAEVGLWNVALTDSEVRALGGGKLPTCIRPASLVAYWPLPSISDLTDHAGSYDLTAVNTPVSSPHPTMSGCGGGMQSFY